MTALPNMNYSKWQGRLVPFPMHLLTMHSLKWTEFGTFQTNILMLEMESHSCLQCFTVIPLCFTQAEPDSHLPVSEGDKKRQLRHPVNPLGHLLPKGIHIKAYKVGEKSGSLSVMAFHYGYLQNVTSTLHCGIITKCDIHHTSSVQFNLYKCIYLKCGKIYCTMLIG